jgi:hypothetical protein
LQLFAKHLLRSYTPAEVAAVLQPRVTSHPDLPLYKNDFLGYCKKYPISNLSFEELDKLIRERKSAGSWPGRWIAA